MVLKREKQLGEILEAFCFIQRTKPTNSEYFVWMQDYCDTVGFDEFKDQFLHVLYYLQLNADHKTINTYYDNIYEFWTNFLKIIQPELKYSLREYLLRGFLKFTDHSNDTFRYRICESILAILSGDTESSESLPDDILEELRERMLRRMKDVTLVIKLKAIGIVKYIQNVQDNDDVIVDVLIEYLTSSVVKVRLAAIDSIEPVPKTIQPLLNRIRDVSENVRILTCKKFTVIPAQLLSIVERRTLLRNAFKDFSEEVTKCIEDEVLPWWLKCYNENYIELSRALLPDNNNSDIKETKKLIEKVLSTLFRSQPILSILEQLKLNNKLLDEADLNWPQVIFWRCLIQHFINQDDGNLYLEQILPETSDFCQYLYNYYSTNKDKSLSELENQQFQLILEELVEISLACDISDECNRATHRETMLRLLAGDISTDVVATIFKYLCQTIPDIKKRITFICEFISELRTSCEGKFDVDYAEYEENTTNIRKEINKLMDEQRTAVKELNMQKADLLKTEIENLKQKLQVLNETMRVQEEQPERNNDPLVILKCATIIMELLQSPQIVRLNNSLKTLSEEIVKDLAVITDVNIQATVLKCYAMLSSLDKTASTICLQLFSPILISYRDSTSEIHECMLITLIVCITDIILIWGESVFPKEEEEDFDSSNTLDRMFSFISYKETIQIIVSMMDNENDLVREMSGIAITKMLDLDCIQSPLLLSRVILKWFNPLTAEKDVRLHQYLGVFLSNFNLQSHAEEQYIDAIIPTIVAITTAPANSPLYSISTDTLIKFLIQVTSPQVTNNTDLHKKIAKLLAAEITKDIENLKCNLIYSKALTYLDIYNRDNEFMNSMLDILDDIIVEIEDSVHNSHAMKRNINKCIYLLNENLHEHSNQADNSS